MQGNRIFWLTLLVCVIACCMGAGASQSAGDAMEFESDALEGGDGVENEVGDILEEPETGDRVVYIGPGAGSTFSVAYHPSLLYLIAGILLLPAAGVLLYVFRRRCRKGDGR
ncbi:MAG: hypothetical protein XD88_0156 [Methanocalculus sp. 52_23]|nr:MAG: hypothetical protein XD88_0156 [Methanocalculus sp. 52_23]